LLRNTKLNKALDEALIPTPFFIQEI
jgi:hypothetical protein